MGFEKHEIFDFYFGKAIVLVTYSKINLLKVPKHDILKLLLLFITRWILIQSPFDA